MICDCMKETEKKLQEKGYDEAKLINTAFSFSEKMEVFLMIPYNYREKKKNGEYKKALSEISVRANYCPFCGKPLKQEVDNG